MTRPVRYILLAALALVVNYPFLWMLGTSLKTLRAATEPTLVFWPEQWLWSNYAEMFQAAPFARYFLNTFFVAGVVTAAVTVTSLMAAYAFARLHFPGRNLLFAAVLATMLIPFEAVLIPNFVFISRLGWYNAYAALIVPWCASAFAIFLLRQAFLQLPRDYYDAARLDGCGHIRFLVYVAAPSVRPAAITVALFAFLASYNALLWPLVVTGTEDMRVVQVGLTAFSGAGGVRVNLLMCAAALVMAPTVLLYFFAQRYFEEGFAGAGLKQ